MRLEDAEPIHHSQRGSQVRKFALVSLIENIFVFSFLEMHRKSGFSGSSYPELTLGYFSKVQKRRFIPIL